MRRIALAVALACIPLLGCTSTAAVTRKVSTRAAFDLACPAEQVKVVQLDDGIYGGGAYGATGCGKRISYNVGCAAFGSSCNIAAQAVSGVVIEQPKQ
jgi:hypothetical protein